MNSFAVVLVLALAAVAQGGLVKRSESTNALPSLQDLVNQAEENMKTFTSTMQQLFTPGEQQQQAIQRMGDQLNNQTAVLAERMQTLVNNLNKVATEGENSEVVKDMRDRVNTALRNLVGDQNANEAERASSQLSENVKNAVQTVIDEASKLSRNVDTETAPIRDELGQATRTALQGALDVADYLSQQFQQAVNQAQAA